MTLQYYGNHIFNSENHKLIKLPQNLIKKINSKDSIENFYKTTEEFEMNDNEMAAIEKFLFSKPLYLSMNNKDKSNLKDIKTCEQLQLIATAACNLKCKYCYANEGTYNKETKFMKEDLAIQIIDSFFSKYNYIDTIMFFGGEPLLNESLIVKVCKYLHTNYKGRFTDINLMSNLYSLTDTMIKTIKDYSINVVTSLDGKESENDKNRVDLNDKGTYNIVNDNIYRLKQKTNQPLKIQATVSTNPERDFVETKKDLMKQFSKDYDIKLATINEVKNLEASTTYSDHEISVKEKTSNLIEEIHASINYNILTDDVLSLYYFIIGQKQDYKCNAGVEIFTVFPDGEIYPCQLFGLDESKKYKLGTISTTKVFDFQKFNEVQSDLKLKLNKEDHSSCRKCIAKNMCLSCVGLSISSNSDLHPTNKECRDIVNRYFSFIYAYIYLYENSNLLREFIITINNILDDYDSNKSMN